MMACIALYGASRLYFELTAGFTLSNIHSDLPYEREREVPLLAEQQLTQVQQVLAQEYHYLGKGCQAYVFASSDDKYIIKFLKYQRFRPQAFLNYFSFIPAIDKQRQKKILQKQEKLKKLFSSWKIAYESLPKETGLIFLHLNKTSYLKQPLILYDKLGFKHLVNPDELEFLVQRKAKMLCPTIEDSMKQGKIEEAKTLITRLVDTIVSEYAKGIADADHALMQNTGVINGQPVHIDVGQFVEDVKLKRKEEHQIELFSKMYKFRIWLGKRYPELEAFLSEKLLNIIGPEMRKMKPRLKTVDEGA